MAFNIEQFLVNEQIGLKSVVISYLITNIVICFISYYFFKIKEKSFADII